MDSKRKLIDQNKSPLKQSKTIGKTEFPPELDYKRHQDSPKTSIFTLKQDQGSTGADKIQISGQFGLQEFDDSVNPA